jgi:hypothetical protein
MLMWGSFEMFKIDGTSSAAELSPLRVEVGSGIKIKAASQMPRLTVFHNFPETDESLL